MNERPPRFIRTDGNILVAVSRIDALIPLDGNRFKVVTPGGAYIATLEQVAPLLPATHPETRTPPDEDDYPAI